jgi:hypothetical protein
MLVGGCAVGYAAGNQPNVPQTVVQIVTTTPLPNVTPSATSTPRPTATITDTPLPTVTSVPTDTPAPTATTAPIVFSGSANVVLGPVPIPPGTYRVRMTTSGFVIAALTLLTGECGTGNRSFLLPSLFNLAAGDASTGAETVLISEGCEVLIEISNLSQPPFTLELEIIQ